MGFPPQGAPARFPFWSSIITQQQGSQSVPAYSAVDVTIQPSTGQTWLVWLDCVMRSQAYSQAVLYFDFDGTTTREHVREERDVSYTRKESWLSLVKVLTASLYGRIRFSNVHSAAQTATYGYSGFKLSEPLWNAKRLYNPEPLKPWKRELTVPLPSAVKGLRPYACEVFEVTDYVPVIMLEEDTVLARDPETDFPVERLTVFVRLEDLVKMLGAIKLDAEDKMGYKKYMDKWGAEGRI